MILNELSITGCFLLESPVWGDDRGYFREWFKFDDFAAHNVGFHVRQANLSMSVSYTHLTLPTKRIV